MQLDKPSLLLHLHRDREKPFRLFKCFLLCSIHFWRSCACSRLIFLLCYCSPYDFHYDLLLHACKFLILLTTIFSILCAIGTSGIESCSHANHFFRPKHSAADLNQFHWLYLALVTVYRWPLPFSSFKPLNGMPLQKSILVTRQESHVRLFASVTSMTLWRLHNLQK